MKSSALFFLGTTLFVSMLSSANEADLEFRQHPFLEFDSEDSYTADIELVDIDGDGDLDALTANGRHWAQQDYVFLNTGKGRLLEAIPLGERLGPSYKLCPGDFDNDGDVDVVVVRDVLPAQLFLNDGKANFTLSSELPGSGGAARSAVTTDVNGDSALDVIIARRRGPDLLFFGSGKGSFKAAVELPGEGRGSVGISTGDLDKDGDVDLVIARRNEQLSVVLINNGSGVFEAQELKGSLGDHRKSLVADLNKDGALDIVLVSTSGQHKLYFGKGTAQFEPFTEFGEEGRISQAMAAADLDGDGDVDLVEGTETTNAVYLNKGNGTFSVQVLEGEADTYGVALGDMNGNSKTDLVFANSENTNAVVFTR